jgi:hypothetical protein
MKKLIITLIILFLSVEISFAITGVWLLDEKHLKDGGNKCPNILETFAKKQTKDVANKYAEKNMHMAGIMGTIGVGSKIVHMKKDGEVDFYGINPFAKEKKKYPSILNDGKWSKNKKGNIVEISPTENSKDFKFGTFIVTVKGKTAEMRVVKNKQFIEEIKLLMDVDKFKKCMNNFTILYTKTDKIIGDYLQPSLQTLENVNNGNITTCLGKKPMVNGGKIRFAFPNEGGNPYGTCVEDLLQVTRQLKLKLKFTIEKDLKSCLNKMKTGKIDIMPCLGKKGDREKYMNLNKYYAGNISISKKSVFSKHNAMFEISAENIKKKQSWHDWGKSHNYK